MLSRDYGKLTITIEMVNGGISREFFSKYPKDVRFTIPDRDEGDHSEIDTEEDEPADNVSPSVSSELDPIAVVPTSSPTNEAPYCHIRHRDIVIPIYLTQARSGYTISGRFFNNRGPMIYIKNLRGTYTLRVAPNDNPFVDRTKRLSNGARVSVHTTKSGILPGYVESTNYDGTFNVEMDRGDRLSKVGSKWITLQVPNVTEAISIIVNEPGIFVRATPKGKSIPASSLIFSNTTRYLGTRVVKLIFD